MIVLKTLSIMLLTSWCLTSITACLERLLFVLYISETIQQAYAILFANIICGYWGATFISMPVIILMSMYLARYLDFAWVTQLVSRRFGVVSKFTSRPVLKALLIILLTAGIMFTLPIIYLQGGKSLAFVVGGCGEYTVAERIFEAVRNSDDVQDHTSLSIWRGLRSADRPGTTMELIKAVATTYGYKSCELADLMSQLLGEQKQFASNPVVSPKVSFPCRISTFVIWMAYCSVIAVGLLIILRCFGDSEHTIRSTREYHL